jgi:hypothetical protein
MAVALGEAVGIEVGSEEVGREVAAKVKAICDRAWRREHCLDAIDALGYHVRLILDNEEGTYREVREMVREHLAACDPCPVCGGSNTTGPGPVGQNTECPCCGPAGTVKRYPHQLGDRLKEYVEGLAGLEGVEAGSADGVVRAAVGGVYALDSMAVEVLSTALAWTDWQRVAEVYLSEVEESRRVEGEAA